MADRATSLPYCEKASDSDLSIFAVVGDKLPFVQYIVSLAIVRAVQEVAVEIGSVS